MSSQAITILTIKSDGSDLSTLPQDQCMKNPCMVLSSRTDNSNILRYLNIPQSDAVETALKYTKLLGELKVESVGSSNQDLFTRVSLDKHSPPLTFYFKFDTEASFENLLALGARQMGLSLVKITQPREIPVRSNSFLTHSLRTTFYRTPS